MAGERLKKALKVYRRRYAQVDTREERTQLLDEFCRLSGYHRKYAIALLNRPEDDGPVEPLRRRGVTYSPQALRALEKIWEAAGYPWSQRLKALLPLWLPWAQKHVRGLTPKVEEEILAISARQIDRRLCEKKCVLKRRLYGRTKPGTLLKHQIAVKTDNWDVTEPGFVEIDLVAHCGPSASGEFIHTLNVTDIQTGWSESRAVMGKGERGVAAALDEIRRSLPFKLKAIDSDNGSEFINYHLHRYCKKHGIQFTRSRPYKKNDNAHIEQKNWTHVRKLFGWDRYDTNEQLDAMNALCKGDLRLYMNLFQPSVKLMKKERIGSRIRRHYDAPKTPLDRLQESSGNAAPTLPVQHLLSLRNNQDPFELSRRVETKLKALSRLGQQHEHGRNKTVLSK